MKHEIRKYNMSDSRLVELALNLKQSAIRDNKELKNLGVSENTLNDLQGAIFNFTGKSSDAELSKELISRTQNNNFNKALVNIHIKQISERARLKYGAFENRIREDKMSAVNTLEPLSELDTEGIDEEMLKRLGLDNKKMNNFFDSNQHAVQYRDFAIDDRIYSGNILYSMMMSLASKGKQCWLDPNESRYKDYTVSESYINNWQCTDGQIDPYLVVNLSVTSVNASTVFTITNTGSVPLIFYFATTPTDTPGASQVTIAPGISETYTAIALGFDEHTDSKRFNILNNKALPGAYLVEWV